MWELETTYSTVEWSADGASVTKTRRPAEFRAEHLGTRDELLRRLLR